MPIPTVVESEDQLPEGLSEHYEQSEDGKYVLSIEDVDSHPTVRGLSTTLKKQKEQVSSLRQERDSLKARANLVPEDVDEDTLRQALDRVRNDGDGDALDGKADKSAKQSGRDDDQAQRIKAELEKRYKRELETRDQALQQRDEAISKRDKQIRDMVVSTSLRSALYDAGIRDDIGQDYAIKDLAPQVQIQEGEDGSLTPIFETDLGEQTVQQFVKDYVNGGKGARLAQALNAGSGAPGDKSGAGGARKEMTRAQFDALSPEKKREFSLKGGRIV